MKQVQLTTVQNLDLCVMYRGGTVAVTQCGGDKRGW